MSTNAIEYGSMVAMVFAAAFVAAVGLATVI